MTDAPATTPSKRETPARRKGATTPAKATTQPPPEGDQEGTLAAPQARPADDLTPDGQDPVVKGLRDLRAPFPPEAIGKLPRGTCRACKDSPRKRCDQHSWVSNCPECHGGHSSATMHLDYVGHADLTQRLLDVDPYWTWEPFTQEQIMSLPPAMREGGLWINLTVLGVTRPGFGDAEGKRGGNAVKEAIGDALRNAGMRFGVALDLWAKGDRERFHAKDETPESLVADPAAEAQAASPQQEALAASSRHTRSEVLDDMTRDEMPEDDRRRWDAHMAAWMDTFNSLTPDQQAQVRNTWDPSIPSPSSGQMTVRQITASRDLMRSMPGYTEPAWGSRQEAPASPPA